MKDYLKTNHSSLYYMDKDERNAIKESFVSTGMKESFFHTRMMEVVLKNIRDGVTPADIIKKFQEA